MRILVAEDEQELNRLLRKRLKAAGYSVDGCMDGEEVWDYLAGAEYDALVLDIMMPKMDGIQVLEKLRRQGNALPVLLLTARDSIEDRVRGLDAGADDYLVKPFGMMEMVSRVRAVLRRAGGGESERERQLVLGSLTLDPSSHTVSVNGESVALTLKEFELLRTMMAKPGVVFTRDRLLSEVWGTDYDGETRTVDVHIRTLRQKLGEAGSMIGTVRGVGYRMEAQP